MHKGTRVVRKSLRDDRPDPYISTLTPGQRMAMVWELTKAAWAFKGQPIRESRLPRHALRVSKKRR
jgi:hypothetical protein